MPQRIIFTDNELEDFEQTLTDLGFDDYKYNGALRITIRRHPKDPLYLQENPHIYISAHSKITGSDRHRFAKPSNKIRIHYEDAHETGVEDFCELGRELYSEILERLENPVILDPCDPSLY